MVAVEYTKIDSNEIESTEMFELSIRLKAVVVLLIALAFQVILAGSKYSKYLLTSTHTNSRLILIYLISNLQLITYTHMMASSRTIS